MEGVLCMEYYKEDMEAIIKYHLDGLNDKAISQKLKEDDVELSEYAVKKIRTEYNKIQKFKSYFQQLLDNGDDPIPWLVSYIESNRLNINNILLHSGYVCRFFTENQFKSEAEISSFADYVGYIEEYENFWEVSWELRRKYKEKIPQDAYKMLKNKYKHIKESVDKKLIEQYVKQVVAEYLCAYSVEDGAGTFAKEEYFSDLLNNIDIGEDK